MLQAVQAQVAEVRRALEAFRAQALPTGGTAQMMDPGQAAQAGAPAPLPKEG
jgi:hypothetical protein